MGWENVFHCEWNPFGQKVLHYYWPNAEQFTDITKSDFKKYHGTIDIISGGFPCQPYSMAGKRLGKEDDRHLWPEMLRVIREVQPTWVVGENVFGLVNWSGGLVFHEVQADLEAEGYEVQPYVLPACAVNAPHRRDRIWFVAHSNNNDGRNNIRTIHRQSTRFSEEGSFTNTKSIGQEYALENGELEGRRLRQSYKRNLWDSFPSVSPICIGDDGLSNRLDSITFPKWRAESIKAGGNAIVPQVAYQIFKSIQDYERLH
jgi:DNA (cytosine-5)-methyltransferase 1